MGKWVIFIGNPGFCPDSVKAMTFEGKSGVMDYGEKQFDVLFEEGYVSFQFDYDRTIMNDYSPEELHSLPYDEPQFILMRYSKRNLLERVISSKDFPKDVLIDCDGVNLGLEQFVDKSRLLHDDERKTSNRVFCKGL